MENKEVIKHNSRVRLLSDEFLSNYREEDVPFTELGQFVYLRTYSRWLEDKERRENWIETCARVIEYNLSLSFDYYSELPIMKLKEDAEQLFDDMFNLRTFPSGRSLWVGDTEVANEYPLSNFNCCFTTVTKFEDFKDVFYLLMLGSGVGIRLLREDVKKLPRFRTGISVVSLEYLPVNKRLRQEYTTLKVVGDTATITVGDSKEGWVNTLEKYFNLLVNKEYANVKHIEFNYNNVRPKGERLVRFGGRASGHDSMRIMCEKIHDVMMNSTGKLRTIDALDISNIIAENVVSGGVRRSSEMIIFDCDDKDIIDAKSSLYAQDQNGNWVKNEKVSHRSMSNNSMFITEKPTEEFLHDVFSRIRYTAEPGFINATEATRRKPSFQGVNPCGEILLENKECCNLTTTNLTAFVNDSNEIEVDKLIRTLKESTRLAIRLTLVELELDEWQKVSEEDPIIGISLTGYQDMVDKLNLSMDNQRILLKALKTAVKEEVTRYSKELHIKEPRLATTVKPEGTISQLPTVSSGVHYSYSPYFIRRVRISAFDPLLELAKELEYPIYPEVGQTLENCDTMVVEFPVKSSATKTANSVSALQQLENYKMFMSEWTDHNTSITVQVRDHEWDEVEKWVYDNWDGIVGITFMSLSEGYYPLLPYEAIDEEEYNRRKAKVKPFRVQELSKYEMEETELDVGSNECLHGVCPIR